MNDTVQSALNYVRSSLSNINDVFSGNSAHTTVSKDTVSFIADIHTPMTTGCEPIHKSHTFLEMVSPNAHNLPTHIKFNLSNEEEVYGTIPNHFDTTSTPIAHNIATPVVSPLTINNTINWDNDLTFENNTSSSQLSNADALGGSKTTPFLNSDLATPIISCISAESNGIVTKILHNSFTNLDTTPILNNIATPLMSDSSPINNSASSQSANPNIPDDSLPPSYGSPLTSEPDSNEDKILDDLTKLRNIRLSNVNRLICGHLNINSLRNKFDALTDIIKENLDILVLTETKLDVTFPINQFLIERYSPPFRLDRNGHGGGIMIYVREDIPCKQLKKHKTPSNFEGIFLEINLRKRKWLLFGGYNPHKDNILHFVNQLGAILDEYMASYDNFLLLGDFNAEMSNHILSEFCGEYNLNNLIKGATCFKNPLNPSSIDLMLTNRARSFQNSNIIETGVSDHHKMTISVLKIFFQKQSPIAIKYRDYKNFNLDIFCNELITMLNGFNGNVIVYDIFEEVMVLLLNKYAPLKTKYVRANNAPFVNKTLSKAFMTRSRLRNKFLSEPSPFNEREYKKFRNYCTNLVRKEKRKFYSNIDINSITDNKKFWKTVKPLFSEKNVASRNITLLVDDKIISTDKEVAEAFNAFFSKAVEKLDINGYVNTDFTYDPKATPICNIIKKFENHPSILKIKEDVKVSEPFHFRESSQCSIATKIANLNIKKPTTFNNIPAKLLVVTADIVSPVITRISNDAKLHSLFPKRLKAADIVPIHKSDETTARDNFRAVSILPSISKIFERDMEEQMSTYMDQFLSPYLSGFRKGFSTQYCLIVLLERWHRGADNGKAVGALLTDLSKAFDCLNHDLLIAKLEAYGFDQASLKYIYSYLSDRKQRTRINNSLSSWAGINSGVPQGSILGPLLFNIYLNDIFFFSKNTWIANYADDNTPYAIEDDTVALLNTLERDGEALTNWFETNFFKPNEKKFHLLISNHDEDASIIINNEIIEGSKSVKLLGIKIDNELNFKEHVTNICNKVSQKLHALARIANFMSQEKLRIIMKAFIESQFQYCPLVWMFHNRTLNNRINRLHERALRLVYKDPSLTFEELLVKDKSFTIHHRNLQKLATEMYKFHNNLSPATMKFIFQKSSNPYELRSKNLVQGHNVRTVYHGTETISYRGPKTWALVPEEIQSSKSLPQFKTKIKNWMPVGCTCRLCKVFIRHLGFL